MRFDATIKGYYIVGHDITDLKQAQDALASRESQLRAIMDGVPAPVAYIDRDERLQFLNATFEAWTGVPVAQAIGRPLQQVIGRRRYGQCHAQLQQAMAGQRVEFEAHSQSQGQPHCVQTILIPDGEAGAPAAGLYALSMDVSAMKAVERQLAQQARTDSLTGLPNRHSFNEKLVEALARSRRSGQPIALLFLDIDKFKSINDSLGHAAGDEVLKVFATRLNASVRQTDTVARLAGDEFVIILEGLHTPAEPQFVARKIIAAVNRPFELPGLALDISTSIGIAFQADARIHAAALLAAADKALYEAKGGGRNTFRMASA
jgi:diguanylate cyclase (GGDEF)-like protein/PAS domain S-box-containing protein